MKPLKDPKTIQAEQFIKTLFRRDRMSESGPIKGTGARPDMKKEAGIKDMLAGGTGRFRDRLTAGGRAMGKAMSEPKPKKEVSGTGRLRDKLTAGGRALGAQMDINSGKKKEESLAPKNPGGKGLDSSIAGIFDVQRGKKKEKPAMPAPAKRSRSDAYGGLGGASFRKKEKPALPAPAKPVGGADKTLGVSYSKNKSKMKFN